MISENKPVIVDMFCGAGGEGQGIEWSAKKAITTDDRIRVYYRVWAMPNKYTFEIPQIRDFIFTHLKGIPENGVIVDPFCGNSTIGTLRNDLRISGIDSLDWLKSINDRSADIILFDPPYSPRQKKECYDDVGMHLSDTTSGYWSDIRDEITRIIKPAGRCLSFGWNSVGIGKKRGFEFIPNGLIVSHGGKSQRYDLYGRGVYLMIGNAVCPVMAMALTAGYMQELAGAGAGGVG